MNGTNLFKIALRALANNKLRAFLTMLGIIIGVDSVITMLAIGQGSKRKGDMSIVGNRPLPLYEAELLTSDEHIDRFMGPAGLTGLWQVEKRGEAGKLSAEERKQLDIQYAKNFSFGLDIKIILKTVTAFVQKENV